MESQDSHANCTSEESKEIKPIAKETIHRICSGQVVLSLAVAMKELVENALDAGATRIDIHLTEFGSELLEVSDNGSGVRKDNFQSLTLKHYTSKIREFSDLEHIGTLGFRGEALSSLCALSDIEITTRHHSEDIATKIRYDYDGHIISEEIAARQQGTTVSLRNLFTTLPVRKKEFIKNLKKEFVKMCNLLYAYCLLPCGIRYSCTNITAKGSRNTVVATEGHKTVRENIISVFGVKQLASLIDVELVKPDEKILEEYGISLTPGEELPFTLNFLISSVVHGSGRSSTDRQFYYINQRPCEPTKVIKIVNEVYRQFNFKQYPFVYLDVTTKSSQVDVNITPDKRQVFLEHEKLLLAVVKASLVEAFKQFPSTFKMQNLDVSQSLTTNSLKSNRGLKRHMTEGNVKTSSILETFKKRSKSEETNSSGNKTHRQTAVTNFSIIDIRESQAEAEEQLKALVDIACKLSKEDEYKEVVDIKKKSKREKDSGKLDEENLDITIDSPKASQSDKKQVPLTNYFQSFKERFKKHHFVDEVEENDQTVKFRSDIAPETNKIAEEELSRHITKTEFEKIEIIGQFNMGFIIAKLGDDLFIVDQHATDEKYNFEQLQQSTVIESQKLVVPKLLELTAAAKCTLLENEDVFNKNGFAFKKEDISDGSDRIYLTSVPISDKTVFGKADIDEMIFMLQEDSSQSKIVRPSRIRSMFASRACHKSTMIGAPLSLSDMRRMITHMGEIDQPWNCPHGRPTMRHLVNLNLLVEKIEESESDQ